MAKWWRRVPKNVDDGGPAADGVPTGLAAEPERLWPIIDVLEAEKNRSND